MTKGLQKLNDEELIWLDGKIGVIDVQKGCPVQCITCGNNAPKYSGRMSWSDYMNLSDSILDVKITKNIDLFYKELIPFWSSDPIYYKSIDGAVEKTIFDVVKDLTFRHDKGVTFTTAGWKDGDNYMQKAIEKMVESYSNKKNKLCFTYSVKTVSRNVMSEYDLFLKNSSNNKVSNVEFILKSHYVNNLIDNAKLLKPLDLFNNGIYSFQSLNTNDINNLNPEYKKYSSLFSTQFMRLLTVHLLEQECINSTYSTRTFCGIGKHLDVGQVSLDSHLEENLSLVNSKNKLSDERYNVNITCD